MRALTILESVAAPLLRDNIDTDQIIPSREMKAVSRQGLGVGLFAGWRYVAPDDRTPNRDFVLNDPAYEGAEILLAGENFGCGSSREHAVWALAEYGVRAILASSFGEIFFNNCVRNAIAPVVLSAGDIRRLADHVSGDPQGRRVRVDVPAQTVSVAGLSEFHASFSLGAFEKQLLTEGLDPIDLTLKSDAAIAAFITADSGRRPWLYR